MRIAIVLVFLTSFSQELLAMSFFNPGKTCVFSPIQAQLTMGGEPIKNATVIRRWEWKELREDRTQTDELGRFELPAVYESSVTRMLPIEIVIGQELFVVVDGEEIRLWSNAKRNPKENSEFKGRPISLYCDLNNEMEIIREFGSLMNTLCTWEK